MAYCLIMAQESESRSLDKVIVRLPDGMRDRIKAAAEANNRSMNAEIVAALEKEFPAVDFDRIAVGTMLQAYRSARDHNEREHIARTLQDFLRAFGSNVSVYIDDDDEIMLKGG